MKSKKEVLGVFISYFETYSRYSWVAEEEQKKGVLNYSLVGGGKNLFNFFKGGNLKKKFGKPWFKSVSDILTQNIYVYSSFK